jgi:enoyl-CoA hydratase
MTIQGSDFAVEWRDECVLLKLTRLAKLNAITVQILDGIASCCDALDRGEGRALIITGEGDRAFCAGTDLAESAALGLEASAQKTLRARALFARLYRSPWTSIAALNGLAYGGGFELALACTFRVAASHARLALPEIKLGVLPAYGGTQLLPTLVGKARALDLMLTGRALTADEALAWGVIDRLVTEASLLLEEAEALTSSVLAHSQFAIERLRRCVAASGSSVSDEGLAVEAQAVVEVMGSEDAMEGTIAFLEKRKPKFVHR